MDIEYSVIRSRRRTVAVEISEDAQVIVRAPNRMPVYEIEKFLETNRKWIDDHLVKVRERSRHKRFIEPASANELAALKTIAEAVLPDRVRYYADILGVTYGRISVRRQKTVWASCSAKGNLSFNCMLMKAPERVRDYVIVHELCHRLEMNHSSRFWAHVESVMPDYRECRKWLKENVLK